MGSITNWYLGKKITLFQNRKWFPVSPDQLERSRKYFQKYGLWSLLLAWVPIIGDPLTFLAEDKLHYIKDEGRDDGKICATYRH